jgi:4-carboxymuconolactone decarboxylase
LQRFATLTAETMTSEQAAVAQEIAAGPRGGVRGPFIALLHHPELARRVQALGEHLRYGTAFPDTLIEIGVLVTARHWTCQYEWVAHARLARKAGVPDDVIDAIAADRIPDGLDADQSLVYRFCRETNERGEPSEASYDAASARFGSQGVLDLLALCGYYTMLAMVLNTARLPLPDNVAPPLAPRTDATSAR